MTREEDAPSPISFDRRIVERNIKRGLISRKDYDKFLRSLPDVAEKVKAPDEDQAAEGQVADGTPEPTASAG